MSVCEPACRVSATNEPDFGALAGVELHHDLHLNLPDQGAWESASLRLAGIGASVENLHISRQNGGFYVRCRVGGIAPQAARSFCGALLDDGLAQRALVEHLLARKPELAR